jgi:DMSO/TMAO reductase YedYZ molybdopterin-dependent catalytic subunit
MNSQLVTRRRALFTGLAAVGGLAVTRDWSDMPPTYGNLLRMGDNLTYAAFRMLPRQRLVREYTLADISSIPAQGVIDLGAANRPKIVDDYRRLLDGGFAEWRLSVEGRVATPRAFSLNELKHLPSRTQITRHVCEEGWSAIAQWTGVPLRTVLETAGILPTARSVVLYSYDDWLTSIDLSDALHPQTILAYGMNGRDLPMPHGAPVRLRLETQLGQKSLKYLQRIVVKDEFDDGGAKGEIQNGWAWYMGI